MLYHCFNNAVILIIVVVKGASLQSCSGPNPMQIVHVGVNEDETNWNGNVTILM